MIISIIVAADTEFGIGCNNCLLWHLPDDFKRFKKLTMGKPIIMGRKTYQSIGKPLPGRLNIVISRNPNFSADGIKVLNSLESALDTAKETDCDEVFIIGGGMVYKQALPMTDKIYLTKVVTTIKADTFFEIPDPENWKETFREHHPSDSRHEFAFDFIDYQRK